MGKEDTPQFSVVKLIRTPLNDVAAITFADTY